jgi:hypothetical protein
MEAFKKYLLEIVDPVIAYRKKYSFPNKVITKKMGVSKNLAKLLKPGKSKIYLADILKSYEKAYLLKSSYKCTKAYMEKLGYAATRDPRGRVYYGLIDYTNCDPGSVISEEISNLEKFTKLIKRGESKIYLSDIKKSYKRAYLPVLFDNNYKSYLKRLGYVAILDPKGRTYYESIDYIDSDTGVITKKLEKKENFSRWAYHTSDPLPENMHRDVTSCMKRLGYVGEAFHLSMNTIECLTTNAIYRWKYSLPSKIITKRVGNFEKLSKLIKSGESKIYLSHIIKIYAKSYPIRLCHVETKSYMERLGYVAYLDEKGNIYYNLIDYTRYAWF